MTALYFSFWGTFEQTLNPALADPLVNMFWSSALWVFPWHYCQLNHALKNILLILSQALLDLCVLRKGYFWILVLKHFLKIEVSSSYHPQLGYLSFSYQLVGNLYKWLFYLVYIYYTFVLSSIVFVFNFVCGIIIYREKSNTYKIKSVYLSLMAPGYPYLTK